MIEPLLKPDTSQQSKKKTDRGTELKEKDASTEAEVKQFETDPSRPYAHPYFWAPFILMGNWK
jgi:CHAT domain-containing protein